MQFPSRVKISFGVLGGVFAVTSQRGMLSCSNPRRKREQMLALVDPYSVAR